MNNYKNIEDFTPLFKIERLVNLNISETNILDISFLENNKNILKDYICIIVKILKILLLYLNW